MRKKFLLVISLMLTACLLSGCVFLPGTVLSAMLSQQTDKSSGTEESAAANGNTVTISRQEYERYKQFDELLDLMDAADIYFYEEPDKASMLEGAAMGILAGLGDYYTFYYTPEKWQELWEDDEGNYAGLGILISASYVTGMCTISRVFKGSPAEAAGVQRGDILYKVGDELYVTAENLQEAVDIMRGEPGTAVDVTFLRNGEELILSIERAEISVNQIESTMLTDKVGYIAFYEFAGKCDEEFENNFNSLLTQGAEGLIIDLRDNPGGWVEAAQHVADLFVDKGDLCYLVYRDGYEDHCYQTTDGKTVIPLVLLVNENSASSSEILTACLKERADATVVGVQTFGKGIVQIVMEVGDKGAGYQMTVAQYYTPERNAVHKIGITPDVEIPLEEGDNGMYDFADPDHDPQLKKALEVMEEKMK